MLQPPPAEGGRVKATVAIHVLNLSSINEVDERFQLTGYLLAQWRDPRLTYQPTTATDVADTLTLALRSSGLARVRVRQRPRLLSDNRPSYLSGELASWLAEHAMTHTRGQPYHPMTPGKIERYHRSLKNQILWENYYLPGQLEARLAEFVDYYNNCRDHESLNNLTPADTSFGRAQTMLTRRPNIKRKTLVLRRQLHHQAVA
jgi:hypothetical protein